MPKSTLTRITDREQAVADLIDAARARIEELAGHLHELEAERDELGITRKNVLRLEQQDPDTPPTALPFEHPHYQLILAALADATTPMRARDLCHALDLGQEATHINGMRHKLKRLASRGLIHEPEQGLFEHKH